MLLKQKGTRRRLDLRKEKDKRACRARSTRPARVRRARWNVVARVFGRVQITFEGKIKKAPCHRSNGEISPLFSLRKEEEKRHKIHVKKISGVRRVLPKVKCETIDAFRINKSRR